MGSRLYFDVTSKSLNKKNEELCGDKVEVVRTGDDVIVVLSDGLGSGVKANILATLTSKIIATMMKSGASLEDTVDTIVHTLPVCKVRHMAYSTFSILKLTAEGKAYLTEFDCPGCVYVHDGVVLPIEYTTREVGGKAVREASFDLTCGDMLLLFSDGVIYAGLGELMNLGWDWENVCDFVQDNCEKENTSARMTAALIGACDDLYMRRPGDDTTVATVKAVPQQIVSMFAGPPKYPEDDERMVADFMAPEGLKMVCGGSSANLVARVLGREVTTDLNYDGDLPPVAHIKGLDLVTEGVLTLRQALALVKRYLADPADSETLKLLEKSDGAAQIARMLLEHCTHLNLFIGRAINPAHQNPQLPVDLSIKIRLLEDLTELLRGAGKVVTLHYY
jgi:protein serine/threonine phosphatase